MNFLPIFSNRDAAVTAQPQGVRFELIRHRWAALGGPDAAELAAAGPEPALWHLTDLLRCPVAIHRLLGETGAPAGMPVGEPVWWGFVERVEITCGELAFAVSLAEMANQVRVWYRPALPNTDYRLPWVATAWNGDAASQAVYGVKEFQEMLPESSASGAAGLRDVLLGQRKYPVRTLVAERLPAAVEPVTGLGAGRQDASAPGGDNPRARVICRGWWHTAGWRHYEQPAGMQMVAGPGGSSLTPMGDAAQQRIRGTFFTPVGISSWPAVKVFLRLGIPYGAPADSLQVDFQTAGGVSLATAAIAAPAITKSGWYEFTLNTPPALAAGTQYLLIVSRTGAQDALNYYRVEIDTTQSSDRAFYWNGAAWVSFTPNNASLIYKVQGEQDSLTLVASMLAAGAGGQFFSGLDLPASSGQLVPMWRDGKKTALTELEALLRMGDGTGRYLASVDGARRLSVFPQPAEGAADYGLERSGGVSDPSGMPLPPGTCVAGVWMRAAGLAQAAVVGPTMADPLRVFVEAMEWDNGRQRYLISPGS